MSTPDDITLFSTVDRTKEPDFFKRFLDEGAGFGKVWTGFPLISGQCFQ
jgi:hypothetical protein